MSTQTDITDDDIFALMTEAAEAGDTEQVRLCQAAIDGSDAARAICERVIRAAIAHDDSVF